MASVERSVESAPAALAVAPEPVEPEAEPELCACPGRRRRVTEADVLEALSMLGDHKVNDFLTGRLSKAAAYAIAKDRLQQLAR